MDTKDTLLAYSEWLDSQGLMAKVSGVDDRSHDDLATEFIKYWEVADPPKATLAGREGDVGKKVTEALKTLRSLMEDSAVDPHLRLSAASTVLGYAQTQGLGR